jgi:hypothetical protein
MEKFSKGNCKMSTKELHEVEKASKKEKEFTIKVNSRTKIVTSKELTFAQVLALVDNLLQGENVVYSVTYQRGEGNKPDGMLVEGQILKVKEGMIIDVTATDKS